MTGDEWIGLGYACGSSVAAGISIAAARISVRQMKTTTEMLNTATLALAMQAPPGTEAAALAALAALDEPARPRRRWPWSIW